MNLLPAGKSVNHVHSICEGLKATSNPMELDLQTAVSQYIGAWYLTCVPWKGNEFLATELSC